MGEVIETCSGLGIDEFDLEEITKVVIYYAENDAWPTPKADWVVALVVSLVPQAKTALVLPISPTSST